MTNPSSTTTMHQANALRAVAGQLWNTKASLERVLASHSAYGFQGLGGDPAPAWLVVDGESNISGTDMKPSEYANGVALLEAIKAVFDEHATALTKAAGVRQ